MCSLWLNIKCGPTVVSKPISECIKQCAVVDSLPQVSTTLVGPIHSWLVATFATTRNDGTIVVSVILQYDVADVDIRTSLTSAEVEEQINSFHINTGHIALPEYIILSSLQVNTICKVECLVIAILNQLNGSTIQVLIAIDDAREVVVTCSRCRDVCGLECNLSLPLIGSSLWQSDGVVIAISNETWISNLRPTRCIPVEHAVINILPHIEVAVGIEALLLYQSLVRSTCKDEAPSYTAIGSIVNQRQLGSCETLYAELRILVLSIARDVREEGVSTQLDVSLLGNVTLGILPVVHLETPCACLVAQCYIEVGSCTRGVKACTIVYIGHTIFTGVVAVATALAAVGSKGDAVIVNTKVLLIVGLCTPPIGSSSSGRAATHVCNLFICYTPLLVAQTLKVGCVVNLCLVEGEGLANHTLTETIAVTYLQVDSVSTCLGVLITYLLQGRICIAVKNPHWVCAWLWSEVSNHLVGLLIYADAEVNTAYRWNAIGVCAIEFLWRAGGHHRACKQRSY